MTWNPAPASAGTWCRQSRPESGKPCSSTTGGPSPVTSYSMPTPSTSTRANAPSSSPSSPPRGPACHCPARRDDLAGPGRSFGCTVSRSHMPSGGALVLVRRGEQAEERADLVSFLGGVPELAVVPDGVPGAPPGAAAGDVTGGLQVGHDGLDGAFGQSRDGADVPDPGLGVTGDLHEHVPVPGQQRPAATALVRVVLMPADCTNSREKTREIFLAFLLTAFWLPADPGSALIGAAASPSACATGSGTAAQAQRRSGGSAFSAGLLAAAGGDADA